MRTSRVRFPGPDRRSSNENRKEIEWKSVTTRYVFGTMKQLTALWIANRTKEPGRQSVCNHRTNRPVPGVKLNKTTMRTTNLDFILWKMRKEIGWKPAANSTGLGNWDTSFVRRGLYVRLRTWSADREVSERKVPAPNWSSSPHQRGRWESSQSLRGPSPLKWSPTSSPLSFVSCALAPPGTH